MKLATFFDHIVSISEQEHMPLNEALALAKKMGVELLEVSTGNIETMGKEEIKRLLDGAELGVSEICAYFDWGRRTISKEDIELLDKAEYLNTRKMLVIPGFHNEADSPGERNRQVENMISAMNIYAEEAEKHGVALVMEDFDSPLAAFSDIRGVKRFLDNVPKLSFAFDTGNFFPVGENVYDAFETFKDKIRHVHLKDRMTKAPENGTEARAINGIKMYPCPVGSGEIDIAGIIEKIRETGYDDVCTAEFYGSPHSLDYLKKSIAFIKKYLA